MSEKVKVVVIRERLWASILKDAVSVGSLLAVVGLGVWLESGALQWIAGMLWVIAMLIASFRLAGDKRMTLDEAEAKIKEWKAAK